MVEVAEVDPTLTLREETGPAPTGFYQTILCFYLLYTVEGTHLALFILAL